MSCLSGHKPSYYLQAMVDGLLEAEKIKGFQIDMSTYGEYIKDANLCFGCAATCTVMKLAGKHFDESNIDEEETRAYAINESNFELVEFEFAMDEARLGHLGALFEYCGFNSDYEGEFDCRFLLSTHNWEEQIPEVNKLIAELKEKGL